MHNLDFLVVDNTNFNFHILQEWVQREREREGGGGVNNKRPWKGSRTCRVASTTKFCFVHLLQPVAPLDDLLSYVADEGSQNQLPAYPVTTRYLPCWREVGISKVSRRAISNTSILSLNFFCVLSVVSLLSASLVVKRVGKQVGTNQVGRNTVGRYGLGPSSGEPMGLRHISFYISRIGYEG